MKGFFVTGTDTGVGKTSVVAALLCAARRRYRAAPLKAVQTGCTRGADGALQAPDLAFPLRMAGLTPREGEAAWMCPYRYEPACSPHLAARLAGERIALDRIVEAAQELDARYGFLVVEGAGGVLVPLNEQETMADLMVALRLPVVLAARAGLGTINHTLLSLHELKRRGLSVAAVVVVETQPATGSFIEKDNLETLARFGGVPVLGPLPFFPHLDGPTMTPARFRAGTSPVVASLLG